MIREISLFFFQVTKETASPTLEAINPNITCRAVNHIRVSLKGKILFNVFCNSLRTKKIYIFLKTIWP